MKKNINVLLKGVTASEATAVRRRQKIKCTELSEYTNKILVDQKALE